MKNSKTFSSSRRREMIDVNCIALTRIANTKLNVNLLMSLFVKQQIKKLTKCIKIETKIIKNWDESCEQSRRRQHACETLYSRLHMLRIITTRYNKHIRKFKRLIEKIIYNNKHCNMREKKINKQSRCFLFKLRSTTRQSIVTMSMCRCRYSFKDNNKSHAR